jgi:hypothetical protein
VRRLVTVAFAALFAAGLLLLETAGVLAVIEHRHAPSGTVAVVGACLLINAVALLLAHEP